jgi:heat shock protein HslJ
MVAACRTLPHGIFFDKPGCINILPCAIAGVPSSAIANKHSDMKPFLSITVACLLAVAAAAQPKTIYLNSKTVSCNVKGVKKECLQYKVKETDTAWSVYTGNNIQGFTYNPGYFYTLQVQPISNKSADWKLLKVVGQTRSTVQQQPGDTLATLTKPLGILVGQWTFSKLSDAAGNLTFSKEFLRFDAAEMKVTGRAGCNSYFGNYTADTSKGKREIHFEAIGHTMMACENLPAENRLLKAMEQVSAWSISDNKLYLKEGDKIVIELTRVVEGGKA